ncbi:hypothetical protein D1AOALGA4SA_6051 [Olavius algarvensis Delta 1 endosymbiont]|nr:hypothetical protein D1AOALGA4SA_6051 [Olavius algarvensis Delta 1 endosymbiont]
MKISKQTRSKWLSTRLYQAGACILLLAVIAGCMGNYGNYNRDFEVFEAFNNQRMPLDYRYYYYHSGSEPIAVIGVEKKYDAGSRMWREVDPATEQFKDLIHWIWEDLGYESFAARINDPSGQQVGIMFTSVREITIEPAHKLKIDQNKLQNCRSNILNLVNVL